MNSFYPYYGFVYIDLAQVLQAHSEGMMRAFMMGQQMNFSGMEAEELAESQAAGEPFLGVYDRYAYGVYQKPTKYEASKPYWDSETCQQQEFDTYTEALSFARQGIAELNQIAVDGIPSMQYPVDWRERIFHHGGL